MILLAAYLAYGALMLGQQSAALYPFSNQVFEMRGFAAAEAPVAGAAPVPVSVSLAPTADAPVILYFMGNAGTLALHEAPLLAHQAAGRTVVAMHYRGGGGAEGQATEARLKADALGVYDGLAGLTGQASATVIVEGYSLGSSLALHVAANRPVAGVILDAPYARICELMARSALLPACQLPLVQRWSNLAYAGQVAAPVLILHGVRDEVIPVADGQRLGQAIDAAGGDVQFVALAGGTHVNLTGLPAYRAALDDFIAALR